MPDHLDGSMSLSQTAMKSATDAVIVDGLTADDVDRVFNKCCAEPIAAAKRAVARSAAKSPEAGRLCVG